MDNKCSNSFQGVTISKYFAEKVQMDNSLQDFQESKKTKKPKQTGKRGKPLKRDKNQKDIRTALNVKKNNNLLAYNEEFQNVCLQSGVDVDSEQLQLAIALSKSLKESENNSKSQQESRSHESSQSTYKKIRSTLREYGFYIPETRSVPAGKNRIRRKSYELLKIPINEKKQRVADKLSEILLSFNTTFVDTKNCAPQKSCVFSRTGETYDVLKENAYFYTNLFDVAPDTTGCLLRDWSKIPGRPASPISIIIDEERFSQYVDNQDDLDIILSGTMEVVKKLVVALKTAVDSKFKYLNISKQESSQTNTLSCFHNVETFAVEPVSKKDSVKNLNPICYSPDIFGDEPSVHNSSSAVNKSNINNLSSSYEDVIYEHRIQETKENGNENEDCFCTETEKIYIIKSTKSPESEPNVDYSVKNVSSECIREGGNISENPEIDLTQEENVAPKEIILNEEYVKSTKIDSFDLTQSSNSSENSLPFVNFGCEIKTSTEKFNFHCLPSSSGISNELNNINISSEHEKIVDKSMSPEIISSNDSYVSPCDDVNMNLDGEHMNKFGDVQHLTHKNNELRTDLTQSSHSRDSYLLDSPDENDEEVSNINNGVITGGSSFSFCRDFSEDRTIDYEIYNVDNHLNHSILVHNQEEIDTVNTGLANSEIVDNHRNFEKEISYSEKDNYNEENNLFAIKYKSSSTENTVAVPSNDSETSQTLNLENVKFDDEIVSQCPTNVFDISDEELDYSMQYYKKRKSSKRQSIQSKDDIDIASTSFRNISSCITPKSLRRTKSFGLETSLPRIEMQSVIPKKAIPQRILDTPDTPVGKLKGSIECTPGNTKYVYKINDVTPMTNYALLDTPKVNKELEKYGVKPMKRKRGVQLLEYLYHQTHPFMEYADENTPKRPKKELITDKACVESGNADSEENIYAVDNVLPVIKDIVCDDADWVLQKKEKAKVQSCRLPLQIAFHNYVHARTKLREAILRYEPVSIDTIHKDLVKDGHRYDAKDLLKFLDKKCITTKTESDVRGKKKTKQKS